MLIGLLHVGIALGDFVDRAQVAENFSLGLQVSGRLQQSLLGLAEVFGQQVGQTQVKPGSAILGIIGYIRPEQRNGCPGILLGNGLDRPEVKRDS